MKFCSHCGAKLTEEKFCPFCGAASIENPKDIVIMDGYGQSNVRERGLREMERLLSYFGDKELSYMDYDHLTIEIANRKKRYYLFWGIIGILWGWFGCWLMSMGALNTADGFLGHLVALSIMFLPAIIFLALFVWLNVRNRKWIKKATAEQTALVVELHEYYCKYENCPIGIEYTWPNVLDGLAEIMRMGRANDIKEAVNIMLDDIHKAKMESMASQTLLEVQRGREAAETAAYYSKKASSLAEERWL